MPTRMAAVMSRPSGLVTASTASGSSANSSASAAAYETAPVSLTSSLTRTVGWCSSLSATRRRLWSTSSREASSRSGRRATSRASSASTTSVAIDRRATTVGRDAGLAARGEERRDLLRDDVADGLDLGTRLAAVQVLGQVGEGDQGDAGQVGDLGLDVVGQGQVDHGQRSLPSRPPSRWSASTPVEPVHATTRSAAATSAARSGRAAARTPCSAARLLARLGVRLTTTTSAAPRRVERRGGEGSHRAGADHDRPAAERPRRPGRARPTRGSARTGRCRSRRARACRRAGPAGTAR